MIGADAALVELLALREEHVAGALGTPKGKKGFDYGEAVGFHRGLTTAIELVSGLLEREDKKANEVEHGSRIMTGEEEDR